MRPSLARKFGGVPAAILLLIATSAFGQDAVIANATAEAIELERAGATIRGINIVVDNVFDPSKPEENKKLYRWANKVHIRTHPNVIEAALLFKTGDRYQARVLDESARVLRARGFLADARVTYRAYDPQTNTVEVDVYVRDSWSLAPDLKLSRSGGATEWGVGLSDGNLFGTGKQLTVSYESAIDRDQTLLSYGDANVFNSRVRLGAVLSNASDGHRRSILAERPFFSLDTRWSLGGAVRDEQRVDTMYDLGEEIDEFRHDLEGISLQGGWSRGAIDGRTQRWLFGLASEEDTFLPSPEMPQTLLLPENRKFVYPWVGWQLIQDDYREMSELNDMGRTEDIALGLNLYFSLGFAEERFGSDRDALLFRSTVQSGWEPGGPGRVLLFTAGGSTRREDDGLVNSVAYAGARYYRRNLQKHLFSVSLSALASDDLDADTQVLLGGDNGLRGYPLRYQAGTRRAILTVEERFYTELYPWRLFRVGYAAFMDVGRVDGQDPRASPSLGTLSDVGFGLRLSSPRSSGRSVVHIDLAFPLNGDPSIDKVQLLVETKGSF
jgi:hypothetical protein